MWMILLKILAQYAWTYLVPLLFALLEKKMGPALMAFIYDLIGEQHQLILDGNVSTEDAERANLEVIREATRSSPGLSTTWAKFAHTVAYMKWVQDNIEIKFEWWIDALVLWENKAKYTDKADLMAWYLSKPDKPK